MTSLLFDVGGTTMRMAVGADRTLEHVEKIATPATAEEAIEVLVLYAKEVAISFARASGGIAGIISDGAVISSPHLPGWNGFAFAAELEKALGIPCEARNDAELAAVSVSLGVAASGASGAGASCARAPVAINASAATNQAHCRRTNENVFNRSPRKSERTSEG